MVGRSFIPAFMVVLLTGCATIEPHYGFSFQRDPDGWARYIPSRIDAPGLQFRFESVTRDADIGVFVHSTFVRQPSSLAAEIRVRFAGTDIAASDVDDSDPDFARFTLDHPAKARKGMVVVMRRPELAHRIVAVGMWPATHDARRRAEMERMLRHATIVALN